MKKLDVSLSRIKLQKGLMQSIKSQGINAKLNFRIENFPNSTILAGENPSSPFFRSRSFTKSIAVLVFAIAMPETGMTPYRHRRLGTDRQPTSSLRRRGVTRARSLFAPRLNLDADYYASRPVSRRNLNDVASFNTLRRDDAA